MTEQSPSPIGTVAQEAARLIEDMATMARSSYSRGSEASRYAGEPASEPVWPDPQDETVTKQDREAQNREGRDDREEQDREEQGSGATGKPADGVCSQCGADSSEVHGDGVPSNCTFCPLCRGIGLLRSVRPETVDLLADLAMSVAASLREVALWSRTSETTSPAASASRAPADPDRVQDIPVDDESEG
jgi:hypothetical protein